MSSDKAEGLVEGLIEMGKTAPELCPSCKHLEVEPLEEPGWDKWCRRLTTSVTQVWLCTAYEQLMKAEAPDKPGYKFKGAEELRKEWKAQEEKPDDISRPLTELFEE